LSHRSGLSFRSSIGENFLLGCRPMSEESNGNPVASTTIEPTDILEREVGLKRNLSPAQLAMIGLGSSIGTGLFLGSAIAVELAGPAVILSFVGGACIAVT